MKVRCPPLKAVEKKKEKKIPPEKKSYKDKNIIFCSKKISYSNDQMTSTKSIWKKWIKIYNGGHKTVIKIILEKKK